MTEKKKFYPKEVLAVTPHQFSVYAEIGTNFFHVRSTYYTTKFQIGDAIADPFFSIDTKVFYPIQLLN